MTGATRVLYLLRDGEHLSPPVLAQAATVHAIHAGCEIDGAMREFSPQLVAIHAPYDHQARAALEKLAALGLPAIGIGAGADANLAATVSDEASATDLRTVLALVTAQNALRRIEHAECHLPDAGVCRGRTVEDGVRALEHLLGLRLPDSRARTARVSEACLWIGGHLNLLPGELKELMWAARLREIGKLGLPDRILLARREERTLEEQIAYDRYPALGARVLSEIASLKGAAQIVEHHLENFDGSGVGGLMAHQIPLGSRILRVAGTFAAITSANRDSGAAEALVALERGRGSLFDPLLVKLVANYSSATRPDTADQQTQWVRLTDLALGMVLAEDIWSRTGMKIVPAGTRISERILSVLRQFPLDPSLESVQIVT